MSFKIYKSSAGSGKTHSLAVEYILLCFKNASYFNNILAVTFTNKATEEMKQRIIDYLYSISNYSVQNDNKISNIVKTIAEKTGLEINTIQKKANKILKNILYNYSNFSVSTIDSFFSRILRSFSKELGLQGSYEIELDENKVLDDIIKNLWIKTAEDEILSEYLEKFLYYNLSEGKTYNLDSPLKNFGREIFRDRYWEKKLINMNYYDENKDKFKEFINELEKKLKETETYINNKIDELKNLLEEYNLSADDFFGKSRSIPSKLLKLREKNGIEKLEINISENDKWCTKDSTPKNNIIKCLEEKLSNIVKDLISYIDNKYPEYVTTKIINDNIFVFGIFTDLINIVKDYENEKNTILSSNITRRLRSLITDNSPSFIFEKIGSNFCNFLIDEFQDTSTFQWQIFKPLILESLSHNHLSLVVGDPKQTIYRWREGNMSLILKDIYNDLYKYKDNIEEIPLDINFRSYKNIVEFNNQFFNDILKDTSYNVISNNGNDIYEKTYKYFKQKSSAQNKNNEGYVNITIIERNTNTNDLKIAEETQGNKKTDDINDIILDRLKIIISEVLNRGYKKSDITILVRKIKEGKEIAKAILDLGCDIISPNSLSILSSPKVNFIINLLKFIVNQKDFLSIGELLNNKLNYLSQNGRENNEIFSACSDLQENGENITDNILWNILPGEFKNEEDLHFISSSMYNYNVYELVENLIRIFQFDNIADLYIIKFLNTVKEYCKNNSSDVKSFLNWFSTIIEADNDNFLAISAPENKDAIKISTIHKFKGLQNKVIIIPFANWDIQLKGNRDIIWVSSDKEPFNQFPAFPVYAKKIIENSYFSEDYKLEIDLTLIDNLNLLYVALTRAEEALYIITSERRGNSIFEIIKAKYDKLKVIPNCIEETFNKEQFNIKCLSIGELPTKETKNVFQEKIEFIDSEKITSSQWYRNIIIKMADIENKPWDQNYKKIQLGTKIHKILSQIETPKDISDIINKELIRGNIDENEVELINEKLTKLFSNKEFISLFNKDWESKAEVEIITPNEGIVRPDRVLIKDKEVQIIDFKIGKENKEHITQINKYSKILTDLGYNVIGKFIVYISDEIEIMNL